MSNSIRAGDDPTQALRLSNGGTSVLYSCLLLAGGRLATNDWERAFLTQLATRDQAIVGLGCVGFDLRELAWSREAFAQQRGFLLAVIDTALAEPVWERLSYTPPRAEAYLGELRRLVVSLETFELVAPAAGADRWGWPEPSEIQGLCPRHGAFLSLYGLCAVCNDDPL